MSESTPAKKAASVFPDPVGATSTASLPVLNTGQACSWTAVGEPRASSIQVRAHVLSPLACGSRDTVEDNAHAA